MSDESLLQLQVMYANAVFQAERWTREAEMAKQHLDREALRRAGLRFAAVDAEKDGDK